MILCDLNQIAISNLMIQLLHSEDKILDEMMCRHMILNSLRKYVVEFGHTYGSLVICCECTDKIWRKNIFAHYKFNRVPDKEKSSVDWQDLHRILRLMQHELHTYFPFKTICVPRAEADDIIGTLSHHFGTGINEHYDKSAQRILIISGDKDFLQLQKFGNVEQYAPVKKEMLIEEYPKKFLKTHIIKGDAGDAIPNVLSPDNSFVDKIRQKAVMSSKLEIWIKQRPEDFLTEEQQGYYRRNRTIIDLDQIPADVYDSIILEYNKDKKFGLVERQKLKTYFEIHKLASLEKSIELFMK